MARPGCSWAKIVHPRTRFRDVGGDGKVAGDEPSFYPDEYFERFPGSLERVPYRGEVAKVPGGQVFTGKVFVVTNRAAPEPEPEPAPTKPKRRKTRKRK